jgi:hypothetical protein
MLIVVWLETWPEVESCAGASLVRRRPLHRARGQHYTGPPRPHQHYGCTRGMPLVLAHHFFPFPALLTRRNRCTVVTISRPPLLRVGVRCWVRNRNPGVWVE